MSIPAATVYNDLQGLTALKTGARLAPAENIEEVAAQFESIFMQMMLKSMRDATIDGELFSSSQMDTYQQMFDQQISLDLAHQGGLGLAQILVEQLGQDRTPTRSPDETAGTGDSTRLDIERQVRNLTAVDASAMPLPSAPRASAGHAPAAAGAWQPASPREFVADVWQHAVDAAAQLGVDPAVLVAQSALETGWGKKVIRTADGGSSYNLFGLKAGGNWQGKSAAVNTLEYRDGVAAMERASFRAYDSVAAAFSDYVSLLRDSPRYQGALETGADRRGFLQGLQHAGYATDPAYADKIMAILDGGNFTDAFRELKISADMPLSG